MKEFTDGRFYIVPVPKAHVCVEVIPGSGSSSSSDDIHGAAQAMVPGDAENSDSDHGLDEFDTVHRHLVVARIVGTLN